MFLTVHATSGVMIGQATGNVWLAFIFGFIAHFLLDIIPHGDQNLADGDLTFLRRLGLGDTLIMLSLLNIIYFSGLASFSFSIMFAVVGTLLPDLINATYIFYKPIFLKLYNKVHFDMHYMWNGFTINMKQGVVLQTIFLITFLVIIFYQ